MTVSLFSPIGLVVESPTPSTQPANDTSTQARIGPRFDPGGAFSAPSFLAVAAQSLAGSPLRFFGGDFFDRLHITTTLLDLGNVVGLQSRTVTVWNAFRRVQTLADITESGVDGITFTGGGVPPYDFPVLGEQTYTITVSPEGPPTVDALFVWDFAPYDLALRVVGSRVTAWSFEPDWSSPVVERLEWKTDLLQSFDGSEQRGALRIGPRASYEFDSFFSGSDRRRAETVMWGWGARVWALPIWTDGLDLGAYLPIGSTEILLDTAGRDYSAGSLAMILASANSFEVLEVDSVAADRIVLRRPTISAWPGGARVYPARIARLMDTVRVPRWDGSASGTRVIFDATAPVDRTADDGTATHRGYPVLTTRPNWSGGFDVEFARKLALIDAMTGKIFVDDESGIPFATQRMKFLLATRAEVAAWRAMLYALRGRVGAAWIPTWEDDFRVVAPIANTATAIDVEATGYTRQIELAPGRADVRIELADGTIYYRQITGSSEASATVETLQIDAALGRTVAVSEIVSVSFMALCRLDSDAVELSHWTGETAESAVAFRSFRHDL